jgi:phage baseplate assembly protein W
MTAPQGMAMPFRITDGGVRRSAGAQKVADDLRHLLSTRIGERPLLRAYGGGIQNRLQDPADRTLLSLMQHEIEQAVRSFLPQARLIGPVQLARNESDVTISFDYAIDPGQVAQSVAFTLPRTS